MTTPNNTTADMIGDKRNAKFKIVLSHRGWYRVYIKHWFWWGELDFFGSLEMAEKCVQDAANARYYDAAGNYTGSLR